MQKRDSETSKRSRQAILGRLRRSAGTVPAPAATSVPKAGPPASMLGDLHTQFVNAVRASSANLVEVSSFMDARITIREQMQRLQMTGPIVIGEDPGLRSLCEAPGSESPEFVQRSFREGDRVGLSRAVAGIAETGSLALISGNQNPVTLNYLPDLHIILLSATDLLATLDDLWPQLREQFQNQAWPRSINLVTGPSRTADVEQTIQLGAHGPRKLLVILYGGPAS